VVKDGEEIDLGAGSRGNLQERISPEAMANQNDRVGGVVPSQFVNHGVHELGIKGRVGRKRIEFDKGESGSDLYAEITTRIRTSSPGIRAVPISDEDVEAGIIARLL
jgi:hypothetical protein